MNRRQFLRSALSGAGVAALAATRLDAALPKAKITRVRIYEPPNLNPTFNQSNMVVTIETDIGVTGVGEGGTKDLLEQCAGSLIGKDPFRIEPLWQEMYMAYFYPPGREKIHAQGAMDLALWDIKGKVLDLPLHQMLGGAARDFCECYVTSGVRPPGWKPGQRDARTIGEQAKAVMDAGYRGFRMDAGVNFGRFNGGPGDPPYNTHQQVRVVAQACKEVRQAIGGSGDWLIDFHQKFDFPDALRCLKLIEEYEPYLVEDPVRDEHFHEDIPKLRMMTTCPLAAGEEWGQRWDFNRLIENHDIDYLRATLPNVGGITEMMKIAALCETHSVGIVPHFTGPIATAALVGCLSTYSGPYMMEYNYGDRGVDYLPEFVDFREGKLYPVDRPGLGVKLDLTKLKQTGEVTKSGFSRLYRRPDGSLTHW